MGYFCDLQLISQLLRLYEEDRSIDRLFWKLNLTQCNKESCLWYFAPIDLSVIEHRKMFVNNLSKDPLSFMTIKKSQYDSTDRVKGFKF